MLEIELALTENSKGELGFQLMHPDGKHISSDTIDDAVVYAKMTLDGFGARADFMVKSIDRHSTKGNRFMICDVTVSIERCNEENGCPDHLGYDSAIPTNYNNLRYEPIEDGEPVPV